MPNTVSTDWNKVRVKCTVIGSLRPGTVAFESEPQEIEFDEDLIHWDAIYTKMIGLLGGMSSELSRDFVPSDLHRSNSVFWITIGNDGRLRLFRRAEDDTPAVLAPETEHSGGCSPARGAGPRGRRSSLDGVLSRHWSGSTARSHVERVGDVS